MVVGCWTGRWPPVWEVAVRLAVASDVCGGVFLCCPFSLDEILNLIESVSEGFPFYSYVVTC